MNQSSTLVHASPVYKAVYSLDGEYILTACGDRTVQLWNPSTSTCIKTYQGHGKEVFGIAMPRKSQDANRFASCSADRQVILWDVVSGTPIRRLQDHQSRVNDVDFNDDASLIASASYDSTVRLWDLRSQNRKPIQILDQFKDSVESCCIRQHEIITGCVDGYIRTFDVRYGKLTLDLLHSPITNLTLSNDTNCLLVTTLNESLNLIDRETGASLMTYKGHKNKDYKLVASFAHDDAYVCCGSEDGYLYSWDLVQGTVRFSTQAHLKPVTCVACSPTNQSLVTCSLDHTVKVYTV